MEARPRCEIDFERSCNKSEFTLITYKSGLKKFMRFCQVENMEDLLEADQKQIQMKIEDYVYYLTGKINPNSVPTQLAPVFLFYDISDVILNKVKIKRMYPAKRKVQGFRAYTREQIKEMLSNSKKKRSKAMVLTFVSSGIRIGGLVGLRMKDIIDVPNSKCKCLTIYHDENEEYITFLTPEASKALDEYFQERLKAGEVFSYETPVFARNENQVRDFANTKRSVNVLNVNPVSRTAVCHSIEYMLASQDRPKETGGRYKVPITYGFRKYYNTVLKLSDKCNISIAEKLFGHSVTVKLDNHYLPIGMEELFKEFSKNIAELTISEEERQLLKIQKLETGLKEEEDKTTENKLLKEQVEVLKLRMERMELSGNV
jgi:site-specific recombinase XerD